MLISSPGNSSSGNRPEVRAVIPDVVPHDVTLSECHFHSLCGSLFPLVLLSC